MPAARSGRERDLAQITEALITAAEGDEPVLLDRLTRLATGIDSRDAPHSFRFSAAMAYYDLVQRRIHELREHRIPGLQTYRGFTERRLAPATNASRAVADRQDALFMPPRRAAKTKKIATLYAALLVGFSIRSQGSS